MDKILSLIIPTYNMEKLLHKCLGSLIVSEENMEALEVLVINDGSKDSSSQIAHEYENKYPETFKVVDKENGNYGSCINRGLKEATGKYVKVLDADDCFSTKELEILLFVLQSTDIDLMLTDFVVVNESNEELSGPKFSLPTDIPLHLKDYYQNKDFLYLQMHSVTYRRQLLVDLNYSQTEGVSYTDKEWVFLPLSSVNTFYYCPLKVYRYLIGREGQTMDEKVYAQSIPQLITVCCSLAEKYVYYQLKDSDYEPLFYFRLSQMVKYLYRTLLINEKKINLLLDFDDKILGIDKTLYNRFDNIYLFDKVPYRFIYYWRHHNRKPLPYIIRMGWYFLLKVLGNKKS